MSFPAARVLPFVDPARTERQSVGRVHRDGSITFRGITYPTLKEVPPDCVVLRPDVETHRQFRRLYRAIDPGARRPG